MLRLVFFTVTIFSFLVSVSQIQKLNVELQKKIFQGEVQDFHLLVKGNIDKIRADITESNEKFYYSSGDIASVRISSETLRKWVQSKYIETVEWLPPHVRLFDDTSDIKGNFVPVYSGVSPLPNPLTGKGIIVGIIDSGLDIDHPDFTDTTGKTRILHLWDQRTVSNPLSPTPYNYGSEWNKSQIDSGICNHQDNLYYGHGSRVAGVAVGNGKSNPLYAGVARESDIIAVAVDFNRSGPIIPDAVSYVFSKAAALNKPAVVNLSLGDYYGSHDASDLQAQLIDNLIGNGVDKAVVAAAGNAGQYRYHLGYPLSSDTSFTWISTNQNQINFQIFADTGNFNAALFNIACHNPTGYYKVTENSFRTVTSLLGQFHTDTLFSNGNRLGIVQTIASQNGSLYTVDFTIQADSLNYLWAFQTTGTGRFDSWNFDFKSVGLPSPSTYAKMNFYKRPDTLMTICTSFQCSEKVITVGNFLGRNTMYNLTNSTYSFGGRIDSIAPSSSLGPTRTQLTKPDVSSAGENIITTIPMRFQSWFISNFPFVVTTDSFHTKFDGTSASAPIVAGLAALYFQLNPGSSSIDLINQIHSCSKTDSFTGPSPNNNWGYGKVDAFNTLLCNFSGMEYFTNAETNITVYPNPVSQVLHVNFDESSESGIFQLCDVMGRIIFKAEILSGENLIDCSGFPSGLYLLKVINSNDKIYCKKIVKY